MTNEEMVAALWEAYKAGITYAYPHSLATEALSELRAESFNKWLGANYPELIQDKPVMETFWDKIVNPHHSQCECPEPYTIPLGGVYCSCNGPNEEPFKH